MGRQPWQTPALAATIDECYEVINNDPQLLFEHDGGPYGIPADIFVARLYGMDEELIDEWRIPRIESELRMPLRERVRVSAEPSPYPTLRTARYVLQSNYATAQIAGEYVTPLIPWQPTVTVLCLRYKRRL